ncbi:hypothetical protein H0H81_011842 [Sphagnurus paluster]|uniref:DBF4-type domain-containing protein n=1 Tax=Sphagnurus paluster TaxID=117069 RepID=A0A9P7GP41_9AGAR|nr:hypothetical protein H0H81_011842 [Sphagnurus paluster]
MATLNRRPLTNRSHQSTLSPVKPQRTASTKRPRSPEPPVDPLVSRPSFKRVKATDPSPAPKTKEKQSKDARKLLEREQQKAEFKEKYTRAFPNFIFYFDELNIPPDALDMYEEMIDELGGKTVKFLDKTVTHFISNQSEPAPTGVDKENNPKSGNALKSPIKLKGRLVEDAECSNSLPTSANLSHKTWNTAKLESVLTRLLNPPTVSKSIVPPTGKKQTVSLARLLQTEAIHGTTERDPTQKRHDYKYFSRGSKFVLIEDLRGQLATIAAHEYPVSKVREGVSVKPAWPVLHCHPQARGPFVVFDDKEKRRWEKMQRAEGEHKEERKEYSNRLRQAEIMKKKAEANMRAKGTGDLRRSASMNNLRKLPCKPEDEYLLDFDGDGDNLDSAVASGFLASGATGYMAASGNSVGITSTTGATSTAGYPSRALQIPSSLNVRMKHIITSRKFPSTSAAEKENKVPPMGPPTVIPERQPMLRKSRSTNTLKLPKREEGSKPGYCESCRIKFDDFKAHVAGRKHQRFATNEANFLQLDCVLARVQRRSKTEVSNARSKQENARSYHCSSSQERNENSRNALESLCLPEQTFRYDTEDDFDML